MGRKEVIALRIRTMRKSRKMTHEDLARAIGQSPSSISMYENGRREPDFETLEAIADVFNVPLVSLMMDPDAEPSESEKMYAAYVHGHLDAHPPATKESRIISGGIDKMPKERREQALKILQVAFAEYADLFKEESDNDA